MSDRARAATGEGALTVEQWLGLEEDEPGELVDGRLEEEEMPELVHEIVVAFIITLVRNWLPRGRGFVGGSDAKFVLGPRSGRKPDVFVFLPESRVPPGRGPVRNPPDIMVEVVSPRPRDARRDRVAKLDEYARFGVRYYWIVDPELRSFEIWELLPDRRYARAVAGSTGSLAPVPACGGLRIDLDELWAEVDRLGPAEPAS